MQKHIAIARYTRKCPVCDEYIFVGEKIVRQKMGKKIDWIHEGCYKPRGRLAKEIKRLDEDFRKTVS